MSGARPLLDIQFGDRYEPEKMRRLAEELRQIQRALNTLNREFSEDVEAAFVADHVLATTAGLGAEHTVEGLQPGMVLKAVSADAAAFTTLTLDELGDVDTEGVLQGQVLTRLAGGYGFSSLPNLDSLTDPGGNRLVWWDDATNHLDYLLIGAGLAVELGALTVVTSSLDHGALAGLADNDHPQYTRAAEAEIITGLWDFNEPVDFVDPTLSAELQRYRFGVDTDLFLSLVDEGGVLTDLLVATRVDGTTVDTLTIGNANLLTVDLYGSLRLVDDDLSITLGVNGELAIYRNEEYAEVTNLTGLLYLTSEDGLRIQTDLLEVIAPESVLVDAEAFDHAGRWTQTLNYGRLELGVFDDEAGGEVFMTIDVTGTDIETVNISAGSLTFNGAEVLALQGTQTTVGAAGGASALPATPVTYATLIVDGVTLVVPCYNP